jgi:hypothetical protein
MLIWLLLLIMAEGAPPRPSLPKRFSFVAQLTSNMPFYPHGTMYYWMDEEGKSQREENVAQPFNQSRFANYTFLQNHMRGSIVSAGVCRPMIVPFADLYGWLPLTQYRGTVVVGGKSCDLWSIVEPNVTLAMAFDNNGVPVLIETDSFGKSEFGPEYLWQNTTQVLTTFSAPSEPFPSWLFATADSCFDPDSRVCSGGTVTNLTVYRFHEPSFKGLLANQDAGDLVGDVFFVCTESVLTPEYKWLSQFELSVNNSWSQYAACNGNPPHCEAGSVRLVGREAALALNPDYGGQCSSNDDIGSWFSLPAQAECPGSVPVGPHCSWRELNRVKTINATCLIGHGFFDACNRDGDAPFLQAQLVFSRAFASEDVSQGGCPALNP